MPSADGNVPPLYLYNDKWLEVCMTYWEESHPWVDRIEVSPFWDGEIPDKFQKYLSHEPYSGGEEEVSQSTAGVRDEFDQFSPTQKELFKDAESEYSYGAGAETFTTSDLVELSSATPSKDTARNAIKKWREAGWATETGRANNGGKLNRLTESRFENPDALTDGGGYEWSYEWGPVIEQLENRQLWETGSPMTDKQDAYDPRDWFASKNESRIIDLFRYLSQVDEELCEIYRLRDDYERELDDWGFDGLFTEDDREDQVKEIRDHVEALRNHLTDFFDTLKRIALKGFENCSSWWSVSDSTDDIAQDYVPKQKRDVIRNRIDAKRWAIDRTHIRPIVTSNTRQQANKQTYTERVYEFEKSIRALLTVGWKTTEDLLLDTSEPTEEEEEDFEEEPEPQTQPDDKRLEKVEWALDDAADAGPAQLKESLSATWEDFVAAYREVIGEDVREEKIAMNLESYHDWCLQNRGQYVGVHLWQEEDAHDIQLWIFPVPASTDPEFFKNRERDWTQKRDIDVPPL